ncbi:MAG: Hint domain-containing protein [Roseobacter sp.]
MPLPLPAKNNGSVQPSFQTQTNDPGQNRYGAQDAVSTRHAEISALMEDGRIVIGQRKIPTLPVFDDAFAAFAQGTLFKTRNGFTAVEDLQPGDCLATVTRHFEQVLWIGSAPFAPTSNGTRLHLTRFMADSFGMNRPESFVSLGPAARLVLPPPERSMDGPSNQCVTPARKYQDGVNIIKVVPQTPVRLFHLGLRTHTAIIANGLPVESYHPGPMPNTHQSQILRDGFLSLFPHISALTDFGAMNFIRQANHLHPGVE